jgi:hypothetical protein
MDKSEFEVLLASCMDVATLFPHGVVYIGGIAVFLHANNHVATQTIAEFTHDADFYISMADMGDLRDIEELTPNRRLSKHQMIKRGFEFDIYTERQSSLIVPYDQVISHSKLFDGIRVASLEHLMVLKLEAYADRKASAKGDKDAKDLIRVAGVAAASGQELRVELVAPYLRDAHLELLERVEKGPYVMALAHGNAMEAKRLRQLFSASVAPLKAAYGKFSPHPSATVVPSEKLTVMATTGEFTGQVQAVGSGSVSQKVGRSGLEVQHYQAALSRSVAVGEVVTIKYKAGLGQVSTKPLNKSGQGR